MLFVDSHRELTCQYYCCVLVTSCRRKHARMFLSRFGAVRSSVKFDLRQERGTNFEVESKSGDNQYIITNMWAEKYSKYGLKAEPCMFIPETWRQGHARRHSWPSSQRRDVGTLVPLSRTDAVMWLIIDDVRCAWIAWPEQMSTEKQMVNVVSHRVASSLASLFAFEIVKHHVPILSPRYNHHARQLSPRNIAHAGKLGDVLWIVSNKRRFVVVFAFNFQTLLAFAYFAYVYIYTHLSRQCTRDSIFIAIKLRV